MPLTLIETTISGDAVLMRYADSSDESKATQWIELRILLSDLQEPENQIGKIGQPEVEALGLIQQAALRRARTLISAEIAALEGRLKTST